MLYYLPYDLHLPLPTGDLAAEGEPLRLLHGLENAQSAARRPDRQLDRLLVIDGDALDVQPAGDPALDVRTQNVPHAAILNVQDDYWRPERVEAAGGVVVRRRSEVEVLMIHRRGVWDLPKGKLDPGETPEQAAVREVAEEVGIDLASVTRGRDLGTTTHGYLWPKRDVYAVKETYWYAMTTTATAFEPETREGIDAVAYHPWRTALDRLGYDSLREHLAALDPDALGV